MLQGIEIQSYLHPMRDLGNGRNKSSGKQKAHRPEYLAVGS
jgi:hypothetical protein